MNTNEELKTRPDFSKKFPSGMVNADRAIKACNEVWTTHVEPLQAENETLSQWKREMIEVWAPVWDYMQNDKTITLGESISEEALKRLKSYSDLQSENQKLREQLKERDYLLGKSLAYVDVYGGKTPDGEKIVQKITELLKANKTNP